MSQEIRNVNMNNNKNYDMNNDRNYDMNNDKNYDMNNNETNYNKNIDSNSKCWIEDPTTLLRATSIIPTCQMNEAERINAITRLVIVIAVVLFFVPIASWWVFLILGIILVVILYLISRNKEIKNNKKIIEHFRCRKKPKAKDLNRNDSNHYHERKSFRNYSGNFHNGYQDNFVRTSINNDDDPRRSYNNDHKDPKIERKHFLKIIPYNN